MCVSYSGGLCVFIRFKQHVCTADLVEQFDFVHVETDTEFVAGVYGAACVEFHYYFRVEHVDVYAVFAAEKFHEVSGDRNGFALVSFEHVVEMYVFGTNAYRDFARFLRDFAVCGAVSERSLPLIRQVSPALRRCECLPLSVSIGAVSQSHGISHCQ